MISQIWKKKKEGGCLSETDRLGEAIDSAEAVIVGAGAGMSSAAGFSYTGERFQKYFADFAEKYGFQDMYTGGFYPYEELEEYWAYWSRYVYINRYMDAPRPVYRDLLYLLKDKDYFVLTTNVDHCFQKAGIDRGRLFYTQGDYGLFQCSQPCCQETFENESFIREMVKRQENMRIPSELVPVCSHCGRLMTMNLRADQTFVEDGGWHRAARRYEDFLRRHKPMKVLFLELGTGYNTPGIIKYPFWQMTYTWPDATYACINLDEAAAPREIKDRSICINEDVGKILTQLKNR